MFFKKKFKYTVYAVVDKNNPKKFLTVVLNEKQAYEFLTTFLQIMDADTFVAWCNTNNLNPREIDSWKQFAQTQYILDKLKNYEIKKLSYKKEEIASIIRMFCQCVPIGCSYDLDAEYNYLQQKMEIITDNNENWKTLLNDFKKELEDNPYEDDLTDPNDDYGNLVQ